MLCNASQFTHIPGECIRKEQTGISILIRSIHLNRLHEHHLYARILFTIHSHHMSCTLGRTKIKKIKCGLVDKVATYYLIVEKENLSLLFSNSLCPFLSKFVTILHHICIDMNIVE